MWIFAVLFLFFLVKEPEDIGLEINELSEEEKKFEIEAKENIDETKSLIDKDKVERNYSIT